MSISEQLCYSTIRIEGKNGKGTFTGTGFFYHFLDDSNSCVPCIVTNRHVFQNAISISLVFTCRTQDEKEYIETVNISDFSKAWIGHPNSDIDLAIVPIAVILKTLQSKGKDPYYIPLTGTYIPNGEQLKELSAIEEIIMIGYPKGIYDEINNKPVVRKGITATQPKYDFNGKKEFLIDAACFPGSSGSPIFLLNEGLHTDGHSGVHFGNRLFFLGVLYGGPQHDAGGKIIFSTIPTTITSIPINLGVVIKSEELLAFENVIRSLV